MASKLLAVFLIVVLSVMGLPASASAQGSTFPGFYGVNTMLEGDLTSGIEVDPATGYLWTAGDRLQVRTLAGVVLADIGTTGPSEEQLDDELGGVSIATGEAYVSDWSNDRVVVYATDTGDYLREIATGAVCGIGLGFGRVYVRRFQESSASVYLTDGTLINTVSGAESGTLIAADACNGTEWDAYGGAVYMADRDNDRIMVFDDDLTWQRDIATPGPSGIDIVDGIIWVTSRDEDTIRQLSSTGTVLATFDMSGSALGQIDIPLSIEVDPSGSVFRVVDAGNDRVQMFSNLTCVGVNLTMVGSSYGDIMSGSMGNDVVHLLGGNDRFFGGLGNDRVCGGNGSDDLYGQGGNDRLYGEGNGDRLFGGDGRDVLRGGSRYDRLYGGDGDDWIYGDQWADLAYGGKGDDTIYGGDGADRLFGQQGDDIIHGDANNDKVYGGTGSDFLYGGTQDDKIWGETGNDTIYGQAGNDLFLDGGDHNDRVYGQSGDDIVRGGDGRDKVYGLSGNDDVRAQGGDDWVTDGGPGTDNCQVAPEDTPGGDIAAINCE